MLFFNANATAPPLQIEPQRQARFLADLHEAVCNISWVEVLEGPISRNQSMVAWCLHLKPPI